MISTLRELSIINKDSTYHVLCLIQGIVQHVGKCTYLSLMRNTELELGGNKLRLARETASELYSQKHTKTPNIYN